MSKLTIYICRRMVPWDGEYAIYSHEPFMGLLDAMMCQQEWCDENPRYKADIVVVESATIDVRKHKGPKTKKIVRETMEKRA